ncbi:MAG: phosphoribosyltransferase family protein [Minisyncoccia bacterium]
MRFLDTILEIVFPGKCLVCDKRGADLCFSCLSASPPALRESPAWIFPLFDYRHPPIKKSLWCLKYKGRKKLAGVFAEVIYDHIMEELSELSILQNFTEPILIPIPLSPGRCRERGFNQAELICKELIKIDTMRNIGETKGSLRLEENILIKPKDTEHQAHIKDRVLRLKNISGSFVVRVPTAIKDKNIILIDDILTTGATLGEAKKVLKLAGARKIIAFTIAH